MRNPCALSQMLPPYTQAIDSLELTEEKINALTDQIPQRPMGVVEGTSYSLVILYAIGVSQVKRSDENGHNRVAVTRVLKPIPLFPLKGAGVHLVAIYLKLHSGADSDAVFQSHNKPVENRPADHSEAWKYG